MKQANIQYEDVVIVGAGPIGLAAAAEFAHLGIKSVVLEKSNSFSDGSKAICWSQRTLEILDRSGSAKKMLKKGKKLTPKGPLRHLVRRNARSPSRSVIGT